MTKKGKKVLAAALLAALAVPAVLCLLLYHGILWFNNPSQAQYPVRGVDVSSWQGEIDWEVLAAQEVDFAYIKATEGSSHKDRCFFANWHNAEQAGVRSGAYHFFSFDSPGADQAANFMEEVLPRPGALPPVVDVEFYGGNQANPPAREQVGRELQIMLDLLEERYGCKPVLYATKASYDRYLAGEYGDYPIWIRDIFTRPALSDGREWTFWQYSNRGRLAGHSGDELYIDLNVFRGSQAEFDALFPPAPE